MQVQVSKEHQKLVLPSSKKVHAVVPGSKVLFEKHTGKQVLAIPHGLEQVKILRNLGIPAPSPIQYHYDWGVQTPFDSQKQTADLMTVYDRAYILNDMGTGKTRASLHAIAYLKQLGLIGKVVIVAPLSTMSCVWEREIFQYFPSLTAVQVWGSRKKRFIALDTPADIYIINHDGIKVEGIMDRLIEDKDIDTILIDELACFRNPKSRRFKVARRICDSKRRVWGLTGAVTPNEPAEAWAQSKLVNPSKTDRFYNTFRSQTMKKVSNFRWVPRANASKIVYEALQPAVRFKREECVDIPDCLVSEASVEMSPTQKKFYNGMLKKLHTQYEEHDITAANEAVKIGKLLQIAGGWCYTDAQGTLGLRPTGRLSALTDLIDGCGHKLIVFASFKHTVEQVFEHLKKNKYDVAMIYGDTSKKDRDQIFNAFQHTDKYKVLVAHPVTMAHGVTLTAANTIIWYGPYQGLETTLQANARITRPGQKNQQNIIRMASTSIEREIYRRLDRKDRMQGVLLDMFDEVPEQEKFDSGV